MKLKGRHVILSFVFLVLGFLVSFSYQYTKNESNVIQLSDQQWEKDYYYRQQLIQLEEQNKELRNELEEKRQNLQQLEGKLGEQQQLISRYVERKKDLQILVGELPITGEGIEVTLRDADYVPSEENPNNYLVHERHIYLVMNELLSAGANAVAINGQRIYRDSYISCVGPVVSVDGIPYPAPFVVSAIGNPEVLYSSVTLTNGVVDLLVSDNIEVEIEKQDRVDMESRVSGDRW
ncbi:DUF881 domain-containing protein [Aquibacillus sp. 3ASR75-11]|uniref:DUF881 domain-containing protein n=1 Tax=Terrihalobacillus insolitus TaxID=2950438 RepID=A0A9X3WRV4_9BACI|nr:DUF881 domain-containing protein [Terrihalobacillus insolitus]MDC3412836.1 DUF881 domain-containing protein [Terrihalobacillus insolitus]MDC3423688.1 DUF881 domain-containing protein [Terrihalobacillus insolitus]